MAHRIGIDIGGTFTDCTIVDASGETRVFKTLTTKPDPLPGVGRGLERMAGELGVSVADLLDETGLVVHGTTAATNAILERRGPQVGLLTTRGFRDVLVIRDGYKPDRYNLRMEAPRPLVPRHLCVPIDGRLNRRGQVLRPLDADGVRAAARTLVERGVTSIAIAFLWSSVNPSHERQAAEIVAAEVPDVDVVISSDIVESIREWPRTSAAVLSAFIRPIISDYIDELEQTIRSSTRAPALLLMQINGGTAPPERVRAKPVNALNSGPAAGPAAAVYYGESAARDRAVVVDMGGTSFDVSIVEGGNAGVSTDVRIEQHPIAVPALDVHTIGAGGGSIAYVDAGGALRVGPRSAGSAPGPACYGNGGEEPTVTDANLVLGYLNADNVLSGDVALDGDLAERAIAERIARPLGISLERAALGIVRVVNNAMVHAIRAMTIARGRDPREYALIVGGGAGPLHAAALAEELAAAQVIVPRAAGVFCAIGMVFTDVKHDFVRSQPAVSHDLDPEAVERIYGELEDEARREMAGVDAHGLRLLREVDAKYSNQVHEITYPVPAGIDVDALVDGFHRAHERLYGYALRDSPVEFYHWRLTAIGKLPTPARPGQQLGSPDPAAALSHTREALFDDEEGHVSTRIYDGSRITAGMVIAGPAVIEEQTTTIVVPQGHLVEVNAFGDYALAHGGRNTIDPEEPS